MCHDRERLIDYIYDECEAGERQQIDTHLAGCPECRQEVAGLRTVRQDLLAWDVPSHASIWRPVAPAPASWRAVPGWALAAAASLMLLSGAAGGAIAQALFARPGGATTSAADVRPASLPTPVAAASTAPSTVDVADLERRVAARIRAELEADLEARLRRIAAEPARRAQVSDEVRNTLTLLYNDLLGVQKRQLGIEDQFERLALTAQAQPVPVSIRQGQ